MRSVIIVAAGKGSRVGLGYNKVLYNINGKSILENTVSKFINNDLFNEIIVVTSVDDFNHIREIFKNISKIMVIEGGETRSKSVYNGVLNVTNDIVYVHDAARTNLNMKFIDDIEKEIEKNSELQCLTLGIEVKDTISKIKNGYIESALKRSDLVSIQTPQVFNRDKYLDIYKEEIEFTDETSLFIKNNFKVKIVYGDDSNFKVTTMEDIKRLEGIKNGK